MGLIKLINVELCGNQLLKNLDLALELASFIYLLILLGKQNQWVVHFKKILELNPISDFKISKLANTHSKLHCTINLSLLLNSQNEWPLFL
jgi:hypothetical protein